VSEAAVAAVSVRDALARAGAQLARAGCDTPSLDAELLLASVLEVDRGRLVRDAADPVDGLALASFEQLTARRVAREPIAYILGRKAFRRIELAVDPRVLIPRPETELLVEVGLTLPRGARVVDVGTGSGAVALALKDERPDLDVTGTDTSSDALAIAEANAKLLALDVSFRRADLTGAGAYDAVLANLPYVADGASLPPEIALYEPAEALFGGPDGLEVIRRLVASVGEVPLLALEVGFDQADVVAALLSDAGFETVERLQDLAGHERVVAARR